MNQTGECFNWFYLFVSDRGQ